MIRSLDLSDEDESAKIGTEEATSKAKAVAGSGNDEIVLTRSKPIRGSDESRRKRRDLTEQLENEETVESDKTVDVVASTGSKAKATLIQAEGDDTQFPDAEGVRDINAFPSKCLTKLTAQIFALHCAAAAPSHSS